MRAVQYWNKVICWTQAEARQFLTRDAAAVDFIGQGTGLDDFQGPVSPVLTFVNEQVAGYERELLCYRT